MIKACIFDLDGVVVDTAKYHYLAWRRIADHLGFEFTELDNEQLKGLSRVDSLDKLISMGNTDVTAKLRSKLLLTKNNWYLEMVQQMDASEILPGILPFIYELKKAGIKIALGSASKNAPLILTKIGLIDLFESVIDGNAVSQSKPDPEVFLRAAIELGISPGDCVVFEDSVFGIDAAIAGGFIPVGIGSPDILGHAQLVIPDFSNFSLEKLKEMLAVHFS